MKVGIYGKKFDKLNENAVVELISRLEQASIEIAIYEPFYDLIKPKIKLSKEVSLFSASRHIVNKIDFLFSLGGDGTLLETLALVKGSGIPILGINTGRLGFLSSVSESEIAYAIDSLCTDNYSLDSRTLVKLTTSNNLFGDLNFALNEFTLLKKDTSSMITIHSYLNGLFLNSYWADGLIVSTPTGSTAYSLSCGGPIVVPDSENFVVTPIAPHNLNVRPIIISDKDILTLKVEGRHKNFLVSLDSHSENIDSSIEMTVQRAPFKVNLVRLQNQHFHDTLRKKLMWGIDRRN